MLFFYKKLMYFCSFYSGSIYQGSFSIKIVVSFAVFIAGSYINAVFLQKMNGIYAFFSISLIGLFFCSISTNYYNTLLFSIKFNTEKSPFIFYPFSTFLSFYINFYFEIFRFLSEFF
jgi:hypothetical protein